LSSPPPPFSFIPFPILPGIVWTSIIFSSYIHVCTVFALYSASHTSFSTSFTLPLLPTPERQDLSHFPVLIIQEWL
jgi:hypothetical protein